MQEIAHSREKFRIGCPVTLSEEGRDRLQPFRPLVGYVAGVSDGLVTVLEALGRTANYHPDFLDYDPSRGRARRLSRQQMCAACRRTK